MDMTTRNFRLGVALVVTLAVLMRLIYHLGTEPIVHIAGDINDYVRYAWNLGQHGVYSSAAINPDAAPAPDSFRPPGFPVFLLLAMWLADFGPDWTKAAYPLQILLSTATVLLTILLGREWMKQAYALAAGLLLALWPHHIIFASTLLSETLLGFCVILALWLTSIAQRKASTTLAAAAGLAFGYAALVNSLMLLFPFLVAAVLLSMRYRKQGLALLASFLLLPLGWGVLDPADEPGARSNAHRATMNFVQGSWPHYHQAWRAQGQHESARQIMQAIDTEIALVSEAPRAGLDAMSERVSRDPMSYLRWYLMEKPYLLWDWNIQLGWGGAHFLPVETTPFDLQPAFRLVQASTKALNPALFFMAGLAAIILVLSWARRRAPPLAGLTLALFALYVTALHVVLQAEPRYSIPYRPEQLLLAWSLLSNAITWSTKLMADRRAAAEYDTLTPNGESTVNPHTNLQPKPRTARMKF